MKIKRIISYVFPLLFLPLLVYAQKNNITDSLYSVAALKSDFSIFRTALEEGHPGIYRYHSKAAMDSIFNAAESLINIPMGETEYKILLSRTASRVGCGHLAVLAPKLLQDIFDKAATAIPFQPYYSKGKLFVAGNFSAFPDKDFVGAGILSINGHRADQITKDMFTIMYSDGNNMTYKYNNITYPKYFTRYFNFLYGYSDSYTIEYIPASGGKVKTITLPGLIYKDLVDVRDRKYPRHFLSDPLEFKLDADGKTAYLKIESFDGDLFEQKAIDFPKFIQSAFDSIAANKIKDLVLDLRNNHGGTDEYGKLVFSYFTDHEFEYYSSLTTSEDHFDFLKYSNMKNVKVPDGMLKINAAGTFDVTRHPNLGKQKPSLPGFKGKIYVLINGGCFSTASECISMIHSNTNAIFIGEESGGGYYGNNSGMVPELTLPNTQIRIDIPLMKYVMAVKDYPVKDHGLFPDYKIIPTLQDKINGNDPELAFAKKMIN